MPNIVKNTTFPTLLDLLAPHSCRGCGCLGSIICDCCKNNIIKSHQNLCPHCKTKIPATGNCKTCQDLPATYVVAERTSPIGTLIHDLKYHSARAAAKPLAELLDATLPKFNGDIVVVPLPTITKHIRARGLDHTHLIAKHFAKIRHYQVQRLLIRHKNTVQVGTDKKSRLTQAAAAYQINPNIKLDPKTTYLLLDDVWTTGASMRAAFKKLRSSGAKKIKIAILALSRIN